MGVMRLSNCLKPMFIAAAVFALMGADGEGCSIQVLPEDALREAGERLGPEEETCPEGMVAEWICDEPLAEPGGHCDEGDALAVPGEEGDPGEAEGVPPLEPGENGPCHEGEGGKALLETEPPETPCPDAEKHGGEEAPIEGSPEEAPIEGSPEGDMPEEPGAEPCYQICVPSLDGDAEVVPAL